MATFRKIDVDAFDEDKYVEEYELISNSNSNTNNGVAASTSNEALGEMGSKANISNVDYTPTTKSLAILQQELGEKQREVSSFLSK